MSLARSCILTYHSLDESGSVISVRPEVFRAQMAFLADAHAPVVPLSEIRSTPGAIAITFDDGFRNFFKHALPVLRQYRFPATVFVVSDYCGGRNNWPTQPKGNGIPSEELMSWSEVEEISRAGIEIGSHTATHPRMGLLAPAAIEAELRTSREEIEQHTGKPVRTLAYPYGESTPLVRAAVRNHFSWACGTRLAYLSEDSDNIDLPRLDAYYLQNRFWFEGLQSLRGSAYLVFRGQLRELRQRFQDKSTKR
jgi:peptidoglycan/xylan/chitin deacetylase (PgdA/CDA1 family)